MAGLTGADVEQLDALAARFEASSRRIADLTARASAMIATAQWTGADIDELRSNWNRQAKPGLTVSSLALGTLAVALKKQSAAQRATSAAGSPVNSSSLSFGSGTGTEVGVGGAPSVGDGKNYFTLGSTIGPGILIGAASGHAMAGSKGANSGSVSSGPFSAGYGTTGIAGAEVSGKTGVDIGTDHLKVNGNLDARAGAGGTAMGTAKIDGIGSVTGSAEGFAGAQYHNQGALTLDKNGFVGNGDFAGSAGVGGSLTGSNTIGDITNTTKLEGFAGAKAEGNLGLTVGPHSMGSNFGFSAMAGAEGKVTQTVSGGGWSGSASVSGYVGAGIDVSKNGFEVSYDKVGLDLDVGAAFGLGAGVSMSVNVSPKYYVDKISDMFGF